MPRKTRHKSTPRVEKSNDNVESSIAVDDQAVHDYNGSSSIEQLELSSLAPELSKKRPAEYSDDANESNSEEIGPPKKKRNNADLNKATVIKGVKRTFNMIANDECYEINAKSAKYDMHNIFNARVWQGSSAQNNNINGEHSKGPNFVIVSYNILLLCQQHVQMSSPISNFSETNKVPSLVMDNNIIEKHHLDFLQELDFIKADILCLHQVSYSYWQSMLECSLKERGFVGDIIIGDKTKNIGVATLYQISRFTKVDVDSNTLSKLCFEQIPVNSGLDDTTLNSIKQYLDEPDSYMLTVLKDKQMKVDRLLIVGNTHLSSPDMEKQDLRCIQAVGMFWRIHRMMSQIQSALNNISNGQPDNPVSPCWILCGDFNSNIDSPLYQICRDGYPDEHSIAKLQSLRKVPIGNSQEPSALVDLLWHSFQHPLTNSCSSYLKVVSFEPSKDYIWMSEDGLQPQKVLMPCSSEYHATNVVTSNSRLPADRLSLACDVAFMT